MTTHLSPERSALAVAPSPQRASFHIVIAVAPLVAVALARLSDRRRGQYVRRKRHQRHDWRIHHVGGNGERRPGLGVESPYGIAVSGSNLFVTKMAAARLANTPRRGRR